MLLLRERVRLFIHRTTRHVPSALFIAFAATQLAAQEPEPETQPDRDHAPFVLHVYANLMQFPTIVLGKNLKPILPLSRDKFAITIDGGPTFHPTQMRLEGSDPIALALVLDVSGTQQKLADAFIHSFPLLAPAFLHPNDHVSIYALDCKLIRSLHSQAPDRDNLRSGIKHALEAPTLHAGKLKNGCEYSSHIWDTVSMVTQDLAKEAGRRVILFATLGQDSKSVTKFSALELYVGSEAIAIFRMRDSPLTPDRFGPRLPPGRYGATQTAVAAEDLFAELCAISGGMDLDSSSKDLGKKLQDFITLLRGRYILEFPRPDDVTISNHLINITVPSELAFIRSTGGSSPPPDPAILADPNTLRSAPSPAVTGTHRPLTPAH